MGGKVMTEIMKEDFLKRYLQGERIVDIAGVLQVGKTTLYELLKSADMVKRLGNERVIIVTQVRAVLAADASVYIKNIQDIANKSTDVRSKLKANETLLAYIIGSPTARVEQTVNDATNVDSSVLERLYADDTNTDEE